MAQPPSMSYSSSARLLCSSSDGHTSPSSLLSPFLTYWEMGPDPHEVPLASRDRALAPECLLFCAPPCYSGVQGSPVLLKILRSPRRLRLLLAPPVLVPFLVLCRITAVTLSSLPSRCPSTLSISLIFSQPSWRSFPSTLLWPWAPSSDLCSCLVCGCFFWATLCPPSFEAFFVPVELPVSSLFFTV